MATNTADRMEILEGMLHDVMAELKQQREAFKTLTEEFHSFRDEVREEFKSLREEGREQNRQTMALLRGISTRLGTVEHRMSAVEDRVTAIEDDAAAAKV